MNISISVQWILVCVAVGYCFGCISTAYFVGKAHGIDIRNEGSGNLGSTNALRTLGIKAGIMTFVGDVAKTLIPICILRFVILNGQQGETGLVLSTWLGLGIVLGHNFPFWLHFKGGKGIAVTAAVILATAQWQIIVVGLLLFVVIVAATRYVSLGSLVVAFYLLANTLLFHRADSNFADLMVVSGLFCFFAIFQHRANIKRLLQGTESKLGQKKS